MDEQLIIGIVLCISLVVELNIVEGNLVSHHSVDLEVALVGVVRKCREVGSLRSVSDYFIG